MITITNVRIVNYTDYDEVWAIVRSIKNPGKMKRVAELSPSWNLFKTYLALRDAGKWNIETFQNIYVPTFLQEMRNEKACKKFIELLKHNEQGKHVCLACFCADETMCHRSIIAGIFQYASVPVLGVKNDYSRYGKAYLD